MKKLKFRNCELVRGGGASRLTTAVGPWGTESFTYDAVGNRLNDNVTSGSTTTTRLASYPAASNRITSLNQNAATFRTYATDTGGNITTDTRPGETFVFTYNKRNRLSSLTRNAVAYATYGYNALEEMTTRSTSAVGGPVGQVAYIYDLDGHLIAEATASTGVTTRDYIWLAANDNAPIDMPLAVAEAASLYMVHTDHLGRPIRMTDATKSTVFQALYKPYGEVYSTSGTKAQNLRFPGQYFQIETGFAYNWHRHYDPITGRYTQPDPLRFVDGPSIYNYAGQTPLIKTDAPGLSAASIGAALGIKLPNTGNPPNSPKPGSGGIQKCDSTCTDEWDFAYKVCIDQLSGGTQNYNMGGHTTVQGCAKGLVSQRCGGNALE